MVHVFLFKVERDAYGVPLLSTLFLVHRFLVHSNLYLNVTITTWTSVLLKHCACDASYVSFTGKFESNKLAFLRGADAKGLINMGLHSRELL
jgi:hypothetical protein